MITQIFIFTLIFLFMLLPFSYLISRDIVEDYIDIKRLEQDIINKILDILKLGKYKR